MTQLRSDHDGTATFPRRELLALAGLAVGGVVTSAQAAIMPPVRGQDGAATLRHVDINGARLAYRRLGRRGGRPLLFVHGYALNGTGPIYTPLFERLAADFDIWAMDLRGHGGSAASVDDWSQETIADDVAAFAEAMKLRGAVYAGHSLGGFTGLYAQLRHPGTFSALALLATAAARGNTAPAGVADVFARDRSDRQKMAEAFRGMYMRPQPEQLDQAAEAVGLIDPAVHRAFYPRYAQTTIDDRLREIGIPVLLVNGARDTIVSPDEQHRTAKGLRRSKEVILSTEGHMLPIERPEATAREMSAFFLHDCGEVFASA